MIDINNATYKDICHNIHKMINEQKPLDLELFAIKLAAEYVDMRFWHSHYKKETEKLRKEHLT